MPLTTAQIQNAYVAFFNRPADVAGLTYWSSYAGSTADLLNTFAQSAEYKALYSGLNNTQMVNAVYQNLFAHTPDVAGLTYWVTQLDQGKLSIGNIADAINKGAQGTDATIIANKVTAATAFTNALDTTAEIVAYAGVNSPGLAAVKSWLAAVTSDAATLTSATSTTGLATITGTVLNNVASTGSTFALTTSIDNITGTSGNDTIIGDFGVTNQVSAADQIDGGAGTDEFQLYGTLASLPTIIKNVEKINLSGYGDNKSINVSTLSGVTDLVLRNQTTQTTGDTTVTIAAGQTVTLNTVQDSAGAANEVIITGASSITSNTVVLDKAGDAATGGNALEVEIQGTGVKTLNLQTANNASRIKLQDETTTGDFAVDTINITGDKNLTVDAIAASTATKVTVAAGSFTGALDLTLSATENFEVTGGTGSDRFNFGGALDASDKVAGGEGTDKLATSTATVNAAFAAIIDGKTNGVANNSSIEVLEYTGTGAYVLDASLIQMSTLKTYSTTGAFSVAVPTDNGTTAGTAALTVTGQSNAQTFSIEANVTGGAGQANTATNAAGGNGAAGVTFAPAVNNGDNTLNLSLKGVTITGGAAGANTAQASGTGASGGNAADFSNFETINITSTGATAAAVNTFTGGAGATPGTGTAGAAGSTVVVSANAKINVSGANEINLGTISSSNQPVTVDASNLTGKMTVGTGTGADVIKGGAGVNLITLAGGADQIDLSKSVAKADVITISAATSTSAAASFAITGFTNSGTSTIGDKLDVAGTATIQADVSAGTATGVTNLTASATSGIMTFTGSAAATATLADKLAAAVSTNFANSANEAIAFEHNGSTYIVSNQDGNTTFTDGTDIVVQLVGVTGMTALSTTASGATTAWVA